MEKLKPFLKSFILWAVTTFSIFLLCMAFSFCSVHVENGSSLPESYQGDPIEITNFVYDEQAGGYLISLDTGTYTQGMALNINNQSLSIWQNDVLVHEADSPRENQYVTTVPLNSIEDGQLDLRIVARSPLALPNIFSFSGSHVPTLFLGTQLKNQQLINIVSEIQLILLGIYSAMALILFLFFYKKPSESYLLHAAFISCAMIVMTMSLMNTQLIHIPYDQYKHFISTQYIVPLALTAYICIHKTRPSLPHLLSTLTSTKVFLVFTIAFILVQELFHINMYNLLRRILWIPVISSHAYAFRDGKRGTQAMLMSYAFSDGIALYLYWLGACFSIPHGLFGMYLRPSQFMYIPFLLCCLVHSIHKFTMHFSQAEISSEQKEQINQQLEILVCQRTSELRQEQQRRHNMMQQIFHDLRSPIFVIKASLSQLSAQDIDSVKNLSVINSRVDYLERLAENLFLSAKMDDNELIYDQDFVYLPALLDNIIQALMIPAREKQITIEYNQFPACSTWGDELRLQQALLNIADNAIQYTQPGGHVHIAMSVVTDRIHISIEDNGIGIAECDLSRIFERYHHSKRRKQSSGLGLYISRNIIKAHGGDICVSSEVDHGSVFTIALPLCPQNEEEYK